MPGVYDDATCAACPPAATPESSAAPTPASDEAEAPFVASVGVAAGRERRLLLVGLREFVGRAVVVLGEVID